VEHDLETVAATLLSYVRASGALVATAAIPGATVTVDLNGDVLAEREDAPGPQPVDASAAAPLDLGLQVRELPPMDVDPVTAEVRGMIGALEHLAEGVSALARALGGRSVALVQFPTVDEETPFALSAREGEGTIVVVGDEQYEMAVGWPPPRGGGADLL
jgi:hypothetical protein